PGAYFILRGKRVKVQKTECDTASAEQGRLFEKDGIPHLACGEGSVALLVVQPEGKKPMDGAAWLKGIRLENGETIDRP
ncbi:MAG: methionyl-tRNA formyltransferase, partial [Pyramidobacter sp.]|nr:methionyl-tRNA formyltransferase [Pyramidobacter sp.]